MHICCTDLFEGKTSLTPQRVIQPMHVRAYGRTRLMSDEISMTDGIITQHLPLKAVSPLKMPNRGKAFVSVCVCVFSFFNHNHSCYHSLEAFSKDDTC